jgi:DNA helicase II / ATP-dependent DNA helicase PcrA
MSETLTIPRLEGEARAAVDYRGGHLQIIASAGSGKTEVVAQRVARLLAGGVVPDTIVAFTFTERAAASLKARIERCVLRTPELGRPCLDRLGGMFVGTIHSYCFDLLRRHVPKYETYDVLDDHRLTAFLTREAYGIEIPKLDGGKLFSSIRLFLTNLEVIENELIEPHQLEDPFRSMYEAYLTALEDNRFLTYGQIIARAVEALRRPDVFARVHGPLRHLIVDEYQDVNPAQEALVERLAEQPVHLCVVGDDDQSIYQWRGSKVENIVKFEERYAPVRRFKIQVNRRSRPQIIDFANRVSANIEDRLPKRMEPHRSSDGNAEVVVWMQQSPEEEARVVADAIRRSHDEEGYQFREIAVLCRGRVSLPPLVQAFAERNIPVQSSGRTNLFTQPEADLFGRTIAWLVGHKWRVGGTYDWQDEEVDLDDLVARYRELYELPPARVHAVRTRLEAWSGRVVDESQPANLVRELYELLGELGVDEWDLSDPLQVNRLGTLARCSQLIADYETGRRRARPDHERPGELRGARDRGEKYYKWLAIYVQNWARGTYEGFEGEENFDIDAVDLTTIHQAKGLEWPLVFVPTLTDRRFPSSRTGSARNWRIPTTLFDRTRYEGTENDERRLFYVAASRARDFLSLSTFVALSGSSKPQKQKASRFLVEAYDGDIPLLSALPPPPTDETPGQADEPLEISFSELAQYRNCGAQYRMRTLIGFQPPLVPELGYGKAVHHVLRQVAEHVKTYGRKPSPKQLDRLFDDGFYLPAANKAGHREMKRKARELVDRYMGEWDHELERVWEVERPFELHLGDATVIGRADVILDRSNGAERLTIVDYKTAESEGDQHAFQLQVYTDAGRREGLNVERAFVHDLKKPNRFAVPVADSDVQAAEDMVTQLVAGLRERRFSAQPERGKCGHCDVRMMCKARVA